jgi:hypothetical protein
MKRPTLFSVFCGRGCTLVRLKHFWVSEVTWCFLIEVLQKDAGSVTSGSAHRADPTGAAYPWSHAKALRFLGFGVQAT